MKGGWESWGEVGRRGEVQGGKGEAGGSFGKGVGDFPSEFLGLKNTRYKKSQVESKKHKIQKKSSRDEQSVSVR
jgi:hypothetical protein